VRGGARGATLGRGRMTNWIWKALEEEDATRELLYFEAVGRY